MGGDLMEDKQEEIYIGWIITTNTDYYFIYCSKLIF